MFTLSAVRICCGKLFHVVKGQRKRIIFDHRIWKEFGVEVGEGTEMRSVKSVMEHNHVADQIDKWEKVQLWIYT